MSKPRACAMNGCEMEVSATSKHDYCPACRAYLRRWKRRGVGRLLHRQSQLHFWNQRLNFLIKKKEK